MSSGGVLPKSNDSKLMKQPSRRSQKQKPPAGPEPKQPPHNAAHFFMGNKILDELKILIRLAAPEADDKIHKLPRKRRVKARPLRDAA